MNALTQALTASSSADATRLLHLMEVERAHQRLTALLSTLRKTGGKYTTAAEYELLDTLEALELALDVDASAALDDVRTDLRINEEGYRLNGEGDVTMFRQHVPMKRYGSVPMVSL